MSANVKKNNYCHNCWFDYLLTELEFFLNTRLLALHAMCINYLMNSVSNFYFSAYPQGIGKVLGWAQKMKMLKNSFRTILSAPEHK